MIAAVLLGHNPRQSTRVNRYCHGGIGSGSVLCVPLEAHNRGPETIGHAAPSAPGKPLRKSSQDKQTREAYIGILRMYVCTYLQIQVPPGRN
jgi:hypothetical protein